MSCVEKSILIPSNLDHPSSTFVFLTFVKGNLSCYSSQVARQAGYYNFASLVILLHPPPLSPEWRASLLQSCP